MNATDIYWGPLTWRDGFCVLANTRPWPTKKPHYLYCYW